MKPLALFALAASLTLSSCSSKPTATEKEPEEKAKAPESKIIGRIASVSREGKFVLIQRLGLGNLPTTMLYQSRGPNGRTASLRPSGERIRDFYAADLLSGEVEKGDAVLAAISTLRPEESEPAADLDEPASASDTSDTPDPETIKDAG